MNSNQPHPFIFAFTPNITFTRKSFFPQLPLRRSHTNDPAVSSRPRRTARFLANFQPNNPSPPSSTSSISTSSPSAVTPAVTPAVSPAVAPVVAPSPPSQKLLYAFGAGQADGHAELKSLLGGKGAALAEMSLLGLPVPPGFTLSTPVCVHFMENLGEYPPALADQVSAALSELELQTDRQFGSGDHPLLLSVRSGARVSMPGMMDTVLNLGLNDRTVQALATQAGDVRFAYDSYRRFVQMFGNVVLGVDMTYFETALTTMKTKFDVQSDAALPAEALRMLVDDYKGIIREQTNKEFEQDPMKQLWLAISAVFRSWGNDRAVTYRELNSIPHDWGTAVTVQAMVFGNAGADCATGVAFTRDPSTGANTFYGEFLVNAQGEDVVAGVRTPQPLTISAKKAMGTELPAMEETIPEVFAHLCDMREKLERHFRDVQDIEFTVEHGKLYILQTRAAKRTARAAVRIAVDLEREGLLTKSEALLRVEPASLRQLLHPMLDPSAKRVVLGEGLPASPGAACGRVALSCAVAERMVAEGESVILVREETSPEDVSGMHIAAGVLTARGGMTSHAAVVARGMGRPCVSGASCITFDEHALTMCVHDDHDGETVISEGDFITIDGGTGEIMLGKVPTVPAKPSEDFDTLMRWADDVRSLSVLANADTPTDVRTALRFGAQGVGLCRTEHMFFEADRIVAVRQMILAGSDVERQKALDKLLPMQREDFADLLRIMASRPVTIRFLDPPLHEFLPKGDAELLAVAKVANVDMETLRKRADGLREMNPMLGLRGCRVGIVHPSIYAMQTRAALEAAVAVARETNSEVKVELMVPFIGGEAELAAVVSLIDKTAAAVMNADGNTDVAHLAKYSVGSMVELPRAALVAGGLARHATFFSFGTNDLTQTALGLSRDDAGSFLPIYRRTGLMSDDPFVTLDVEGVGELVKIAAERGRATRKDLKLCLCGEQGADGRTVEFCQRVGLDSVSCSPFQVPVARLAAAQAALRVEKS